MGKAYILWIAVIIIRSNKVVSFNFYINIFAHSLIPQVFFSLCLLCVPVNEEKQHWFPPKP